MKPADSTRATLPKASSVQASSLEVLSALERWGLLLRQDKRLPSVVTLLAGEPLSSSWWAHPDSRRMFRVLTALAEHPDVLATKLLLAKDTFVHRKLWPALLAVVTAREPWQLSELSAPARRLLARTDSTEAPIRSPGAATKELVARLLVHATEVHTEGGHHETAVQSWLAWRAQASVVVLDSVDDARRMLEEASRHLGAPPEALPWLTRERSGADSPRAAGLPRRSGKR
jgi:hypothetical protein